MQQHNMAAEIRATGLAEMMRYQNDTKEWVRHLGDDQPATVQVVHDRTTQRFMLVISRLEGQQHVIVMQQQIFHNMKYQTNNNDQFHQWRGEQRTVFGLNFPNEKHAMDVHRAVREAQNFLTELINSEHINGSAVYQEPQNHYYSHQPTTAKQQPQYHHQPQQQQEYRDPDADSLGSNGYNRKYSGYTVHPQVTGQQISHHHQQQQQQNTLQHQQQLLQQQRRASQGSSGSSSTVSGNIYATAINGYTNGNAVSATANGGQQMPITQIQQQPRLNGHAQTNGHHQVPLRTPVPPAPAPPPMSQAAPVSTNAPPAPPPPPPPALLNGSAPKAAGNIPPAPPPPPPNFCKAASTDKPLTMAEQIQQKQLRKTNEKADSNGPTSNGPTSNGGASNGAASTNKPKPVGSMGLMDELNNRLRKRNNQEEIASVTSIVSTSSTGSTNSNESSERKEPPPPPKSWTKPAPVNSNPSTVPLNGTHHQNGHTNGSIDSPKVLKKQFSIPNTIATTNNNDDPSTIMCTKADLDRLREDMISEIASFKAQVLEALSKR